MHKLEKIILETYNSLSEEEKVTKKLTELPKAFVSGLEKRYGKVDLKNDFVSADLDTYYQTRGIDKTTGSMTHKVIQLPSFYKMYDEFQSVVDDIKELMRSDDVRQDKAARELFELIKTNFRKLQGYLRTERPEQYAIIRDRAALQELVSDFKTHVALINESLYKEIEEVEEPQPEEAGEESGPVLEDATDTILGKFPTLKAAIVKLQTEDFTEFVESIDWISPRPTSFRVNLKNGQDYILKWTGKTFEAQILGKRYLLSNIAEYQQALDKLAILYKEAPMKGAGEEADIDTDTGGGGGGGGDFPGEEGGAEGGEDFEDLGGEEGGEEGGGEDLSGEPIDFEAGEEPEA